MKRRWIAADMLEAGRSFRRVRGGVDIKIIVTALRRETTPTGNTPVEFNQAAA